MDICVNFIVELHLHPTVACLISTVERGLMIMTSHCATSISDDQVYPCCGLFELEGGNVHHHQLCADMSYEPFRQQLLESETAFCNICHKNCISLSWFCFTSWTCTFVSSTFYLSCLSLFLYYPFLFTNAHYWISWRSKLSSAISFF